MPTLELTPDEARILGVLVEKELTTPDLYPLTLHAVVAGANQKSNRHPVITMTEDQARAGMVSLRAKGLVVQLDGHGSRTSKFRHEFASKVGLTKPEVVILAELLLRGPQTQGELRGRASRMHPLDSLDTVRITLEQLMARAEPLVERLAASAGSRAERYAQLLAPDLHGDEEEGEADEKTPCYQSLGQLLARQVAPPRYPSDAHAECCCFAASLDSREADRASPTRSVF